MKRLEVRQKKVKFSHHEKKCAEFHRTLNLVFSHPCFTEDIKGMHQIESTEVPSMQKLLPFLFPLNIFAVAITIIANILMAYN